MKEKAWVVAVNMGYGHQRTAYPLKNISVKGRVINANDYKGILLRDKMIWESARVFYEFISNFKRIPFIGAVVFSIFNKFQEIPRFYPKRDLSKPNLALKNIFYFIRKGWGRDLIHKLERKDLTLISTFFTPAFMAEFNNYRKDIFCVVCDADIARPWASLDPSKSRIKYFVPNSWVKDRLKLYGVKDKNIFLSGYPLPIENIGSRKMEVLKKDLSRRILNLDPKRKHYNHYKQLFKREIIKSSGRPVTILFSIGGAGAQKEIVSEFLNSLSSKIKKREIKIIISVGTKKEARDYFLKILKELGLTGVEIIYDKDINNYFKKFNSKLRKTDILWTKPSELSFYSGLGIPILIAPPVGSQEDFNKKWLLRIGAGVGQEDPSNSGQWLFDYLDSGRFAEAAMAGFIEIEKLGTYNIIEAVS